MFTNPGQLTLICGDMDARPLFWTDKDRQRHGYEPEVATALAAALGLTLRWEFRKWAEFKPTLDARKADAIWCGCAITPAREEMFRFSRPYAIFDEAVLIRRGDPYKRASDLVGHRVGAIAGSTNMALAAQWAGCDCVAFDGTSDDVFCEMIEALRAGRIDAVVDDEPAFGGSVASGEFDIAFVVPTGNRWGAALRLEDSDLAATIDAAIDTIIGHGTLRQIWNRWFAPKPFPL